MARHEDRLRLAHMLEYSCEAMAFAGGKNRSALDSDRMLELALVRLVEIVGEAAARVTAETRAEHGQVPWQYITSMRNRLVHGYDAVDLDILWQTVKGDLPALVKLLKQIPALDER